MGLLVNMKKPNKKEILKKFLKFVKMNEAKPIEEWTWIELTRHCQLEQSIKLLKGEIA